MACDTLLAIQSLQGNAQTPSCLEIPLPNGTAIRGVLECQLHEFFLHRGGSSPVIARELDRLLRHNTLRTLSSSNRGTSPVTVYVLTQDYVRAVRAFGADDNEDGSSAVVEWFIDNLQHWTGSRISQSAIQDAWQQYSSRSRRSPLRLPNSSSSNNNTKESSATAAEAVLRWLQERQLLHAAAASHDHYQLWLPCWGRQVLPAFFKAKTDALAFLQQSRYRERSVASVVQRPSSSDCGATP